MAAPTPTQTLISKAGDNLAPDKSVARLDELAKFLLATIALVGTILSGLGAFTDLGEEFDDRWYILLPILALVIATSICALMALRPMPYRVNVAILEEIQAIYTSRIKEKLTYVTAGFILLGVAIILAGIVPAIKAFDDPELSVRLSASWVEKPASGDSEAQLLVKGEVIVANASVTSEVHTKVTVGDANSAVTLSSQRAFVGSESELKLPVEAQTTPGQDSITLTVTVKDGSEELYSKQMAIPSE